MFSGKILFITLALSLAHTAHGEATAKADCWYGENCEGTTVLTNGDGYCLLPPNNPGVYPLDPSQVPVAYLMGQPMHFCGNRKSLNPDVEAAKLEAIQFCFDIGANSACIWGECDEPDSCYTDPPIVFGDPHFKTWGGEMYDYHGVCDLKFLESRSHNVTIHIRTTQKYHYSFVSSAVIEINGETLELGGYGAVIRNGFYETDDTELPKTIGGHPLFLEISNKKTHTYLIQLEDGSGIEMKSFKDMVGVKLLGSKGHWSDSVGLMGNAMTGQKLARDGKTVLEDNNEFGQEWQVREDEKMLFNAVREPQAPMKCYVPSATQAADTKRRLGETMAREQAEAACKNWHMNKEACISDVMATGDADLAANVY